jgi:CO/xanthine dehydrogenase Mo-binding subunit
MAGSTRKEDARLVCGKGRFVDDEPTGADLHLRLVRSPYAHARILSIDVTQAKALSGVVCILTGQDIVASSQKFPQMAPAPANQIIDLCMAVDKVRFQGEPVVAIAATSSAIAADAAELVRVDYEPLPAVMDAVESLQCNTLLHEQVGSNRVFSDVFEWGDVEGAFAAADFVVSIDHLKFHRFSSTPLEGYAARVTWEPGGRVDMLCNLIQPGVAMKFIAPALGVSPEQLRIRTQDIGGGFGIKQNLYPYLVVAALVSRKAGHRPVRWVETRTEHLQASAHGNERTFLDTEVALRADGEVLAVRSRHVDDCGAYPRYEPLGCVIWSQVAPAAYRLKNLRIEMQQAVTNKCPVGPNRGFSRMQHVWFFERLIDICGRELGIPADTMRERNYVPSFPWTTPNGCVYDSGDYFAMLDMAKAMIGWGDWQDKLETMRAQGRLVGMGIGTTLDSGTNNFGQSRIINPNSPFTGNSEVANVRVGVDGRITVAVGSVPQGQGHETVAAQVVAEALGISPDWVLVQPGFDTDRNTHTSHSGTYASQFAVTSLGAINGAVQALKVELLRLAAHDLELPPEDLIFTEHQGVPAVLSADRQQGRSFAELAARVNTQTAGLPAELADLTLNVRHVYRAPFELPDTSRKYGNLTLTYASQVHIAVVEIDSDTHNLHVLDYAVVDDCGRVINHAIVTGQVHGAAAHGLGAVLMEHLRYDEYGNLATSTFSDYCPITMLNMPTLKYRNFESPSPFTFNGAKGMGEGGGGPLHAMSAAVQDAVWSLGAVVAHSHLPPSDLFDLVRGAGRLSQVHSERRHG